MILGWVPEKHVLSGMGHALGTGPQLTTSTVTLKNSGMYTHLYIKSYVKRREDGKGKRLQASG